MKTIFAVIGVDNPTALEKLITEQFPDDNLKVAPGQWLIAAEETATTLTEKLGMTGAEAAGHTGIVLTVSSYFGRAKPQVWEWIKAKWGSR